MTKPTTLDLILEWGTAMVLSVLLYLLVLGVLL
jgi:hypothetical protein